MFFWNSLAFSMIQQMFPIWSAFSKSSLNIWKFTIHLLLKPGLEKFEHYLTSMWDECSCVVVWAFLWDWNENLPFPVLWPLLSFPNLETDTAYSEKNHKITYIPTFNMKDFIWIAFHLSKSELHSKSPLEHLQTKYYPCPQGHMLQGRFCWVHCD